MAKYLPKWEELSRYLELTDAEVEEIKHDYAHNYKEQKFKCIKRWAEKNGKAGTLISLLRHVYFDLGDKFLVMNIVEDLKQSGRQSGKHGQTYLHAGALSLFSISTLCDFACPIY